MNWTYLLTSIDGRISRKPFWIGLLILAIPELAAPFALGERWSSLVSLLIAYPEFAVLAKRGHDRNVSTWVTGAFMAGAVVLNILVLVGLAAPIDNPNTLSYVVGVPLGVFALILLVDFGFRRGTAGENRYGPDPLEKQ
jgi:uncharacterized membrane protein YhaH (DUF805 family)